MGGGIAASAAVLMVRVTVPGGCAGLTADYRSEVGEQRRVELGDGVRLYLCAGARISRREGVIGLLEGWVELLADAD